MLLPSIVLVLSLLVTFSNNVASTGQGPSSLFKSFPHDKVESVTIEEEILKSLLLHMKSICEKIEDKTEFMILDFEGLISKVTYWYYEFANDFVLKANVCLAVNPPLKAYVEDDEEDIRLSGQKRIAKAVHIEDGSLEYEFYRPYIPTHRDGSITVTNRYISSKEYRDAKRIVHVFSIDHLLRRMSMMKDFYDASVCKTDESEIMSYKLAFNKKLSVIYGCESKQSTVSDVTVLETDSDISECFYLIFDHVAKEWICEDEDDSNQIDIDPSYIIQVSEEYTDNLPFREEFENAEMVRVRIDVLKTEIVDAEESMRTKGSKVTGICFDKTVPLILSHGETLNNGVTSVRAAMTTYNGDNDLVRRHMKTYLEILTSSPNENVLNMYADPSRLTRLALERTFIEITDFVEGIDDERQREYEAEYTKEMNVLHEFLTFHTLKELMLNVRKKMVELHFTSSDEEDLEENVIIPFRIYLKEKFEIRALYSCKYNAFHILGFIDVMQITPSDELEADDSMDNKYFVEEKIKSIRSLTYEYGSKLPISSLYDTDHLFAFRLEKASQDILTLMSSSVENNIWKSIDPDTFVVFNLEEF